MLVSIIQKIETIQLRKETVREVAHARRLLYVLTTRMPVSEERELLVKIVDELYTLEGRLERRNDKTTY